MNILYIYIYIFSTDFSSIQFTNWIEKLLDVLWIEDPFPCNIQYNIVYKLWNICANGQGLTSSLKSESSYYAKMAEILKYFS